MLNALGRIRPFCVVTLWVGILTLVVNGVLQGLSAASILTWPPRILAGNGYLDDNRQRVDAARDEYRHGLIKSDDHLGAFVGISNLREDIDLKTVQDLAGSNWRFLGLGGAGFAVSDIAPHAEALLASDLRPDLVVLGIGLHQLIDIPPTSGAFNPGVAEYLRRGDVRNVAIGIRDWLWFYSRRQDVSVSTESAVLDARERLFHRWNVHVDETRANRRSPWREMIKADWPEHFSSNTLGEEEQFFERLGVFDASTYRHPSKSTEVLMQLLQRFRRRQASVVLLLLPQHSRLRQRIPGDALDLLAATLQRAFPEDAIPLLDFRAAIDDDGFVDLPHLNRPASVRFTRLMMERLRAYLPTTAPLAKMPAQMTADPARGGS